MTDLELAAREYAAELQAKFPLAKIDELLVLAFMQGSVHGMDRVKASWETGAALAAAAKR